MEHAMSKRTVGFGKGVVTAALALVACAVPLTAQSVSGSRVVLGTANIFGAGLALPPDPGGFGGGTLPPVFAFGAGFGGGTLRFTSVAGLWGCCGPGSATVGPDGFVATTDITSAGGISGAIAPRAMFLAGVFLSNATQPGSAPPRLNFTTIGTEFLSLSPLLGQSFFIGDGRASGNTLQQFIVPAGATHLYLGVIDGNAFIGPPTFYNDNPGSVTAAFTITPSTVIPEPSTWSLVGTGLLALVAIGARRRGRSA